MAAFETSKFDILYGKLLGKGLSTTLAKQLATTLYRLSDRVDVSVDDLIKDITKNGIRFDNKIYEALNRYRSNSSQIGYLDTEYIPETIRRQAV